MTDTIRPARRKTLKPPIEAEIRLLDWAGRGATEAELNGRRVPVDRGIPGELVVATIDRNRKRRGVVESVVEPSPDRISPPCPYYLRGCGGCQWQHLEYEAQLRAKRDAVDRALKSEGVDAGVRSVHRMEHPWRYRRTAAVAIGWEAGFRPRGRRGILEIYDCLISHPLIGRLADRLNGLLRAGSLPNYHGKVWLDATVVGASDDPGLQIVIQGIEGLTLEGHPELPQVADVVASIDGVRTVAFRHRSGEPQPLVGDLMSEIDVAGRSMYLPAGSFFQTNLEMLEQVIRVMRQTVRGCTIRKAADIYGGVGTFGLSLAGEAGEMTLVELDPLAVNAARRTAETWGLDNMEFVSKHAERALPELSGLDLAIVDPPRSGLGGGVTSAIAAHRIPLVLYVSCSPPSLATDLAALQRSGYRVRSLDIFDFYPQTYHVESLAILELCP